jgi:hypothetical protein
MKMFILAILLERRKEQKKLNSPISAKLAPLLEIALYVPYDYYSASQCIGKHYSPPIQLFILKM